jgi:UDP-glucose 4-epimerase
MRPKVLVTGGLGYIGSHTVVALQEAGYDPTVLDFNTWDYTTFNRLQKFGFNNLLKGDCREDAWHNLEFDAIIHFAAYKSVPESESYPLKYFDNNLYSLINILNSIKTKKFLFSSSCAVYGDIPCETGIKETQLLRPSSVYGITKMQGEQILEKTNSIETRVSLRYFNPIGAHESGLLGDLGEQNVMHFLNKKEFTIHGTDYATPDGTCIRDYIHVVDLARSHVEALKSNSGYHIFNVGTGNGTSVKELVETFNRIGENRIEKVYFGQRRKGDVPAVWADASLFEKTFGWKAELSIEDAIRSHLKFRKLLG